MIRILIFALIATTCQAAETNKVAKVEKEKKAEHQADKITIKSRDKGSKKESDFTVDKEYRLMFSNNRKAKQQKGKTQ